LELVDFWDGDWGIHNDDACDVSIMSYKDQQKSRKLDDFEEFKEEEEDADKRKEC
jgi:hypothetical protein